mgnify:CR=1 FL=1
MKTDLLSTSSKNSFEETLTKKPSWIKVKLPKGKNYLKLKSLVDQYKLNTICKSGSCPNLGECWGNGVATFLILGDICTRSCKFCGVKTGKPKQINWEESEKVARSIKLMKIKHVIITSVDRDDLKDMGSFLWVETIQSIRRICPSITMETLIPDFQGTTPLLDLILQSHPEIISHNIETVRRLTNEIRIQAKYERSIEVLHYLKKKGQKLTKSSIMLGIGENEEEVIETMEDLKKINVDIITLGQYLQPSPKHTPVKDFIKPSQFQKYKSIGMKMGFRHVESAPFVRSSYHADRHIL